MKFYIILIAAACLVLLPWSVFNNSIGVAAAAEEPSAAALNAPGVAPPLVREGDFAVKLDQALMASPPRDESTAESALAAMGIAPDNGWIADYPVTPLIISQLRKSIQKAADAGSLAMSSASAMASLRTVSDDFNLNIVAAGSSENQAAGEPATASNTDVGPAGIENYYQDSGPPVITYYSPPAAYIYLYTWVPYPFQFDDLYFPGYYILNDFDTFVVVHHRRAICTNHVFSRRTGRVLLVHPDDGGFYRSARAFSHVNRFGVIRHDGIMDHHDDAHRYHEWAHRDHAWVSSHHAQANRNHAWVSRDHGWAHGHQQGHHDGAHGRSFENRGFGHSFAERDSPRPGHVEQFSRPHFEGAHPHMGNFAHRGAPEAFHGAHFGRISHSGTAHGISRGGFHGGWFGRR